jgi:hypothetical protein
MSPARTLVPGSPVAQARGDSANEAPVRKRMIAFPHYSQEPTLFAPMAGFGVGVQGCRCGQRHRNLTNAVTGSFSLVAEEFHARPFPLSFGSVAGEYELLGENKFRGRSDFV